MVFVLLLTLNPWFVQSTPVPIDSLGVDSVAVLRSPADMKKVALLSVVAGGAAAAGLPTSSTRLVGPGDVEVSELLDVRQTAEVDAGHVPGAAHVELSDLSAGSQEVPAAVSVVMCGHGERAMTAASLLERAGRTGMAVLIGGPDEWAEAHGTPLDSGA